MMINSINLTNFQIAIDDLKWCPKTDVFTGGCGGPRQEQCLLDFLAKFGASSMPK
ncbi:hypothetical protein LINPERHAP2_LOCUS5195, partial [Linum perenne]